MFTGQRFTGNCILGAGVRLLALNACALFAQSVAAAPVAQTPLFLTQGVEPQVMLSMSNDHQLFFEAYPDYLDLDADGKPDRTYKNTNEYYGYFDSGKCYDYSDGKKRFVPKAVTSDGYCDGVDGDWSGNFLNYITMSRMDVVRKILYGGYRREDTSSLTVLERSYLPNDAHSWARYYDGGDLSKLTPFNNGSLVSGTGKGINGYNRMIGEGDRTFNVETNASAFLDAVQIGDQVKIYSDTYGEPDIANPGSPMMLGTVKEVNQGSDRIKVYVERTQGSGSLSSVRIDNLSRAGVSFCNTTTPNASLSGGEAVPKSKPPRMSVARGDYSLWGANERYQCIWAEENSHSNYLNGNNIGKTESAANDRDPVRDDVGLGENDYVVRVEACKSGLVGSERCKQYPSGSIKPVGLLQQYGDDDQILFGLLTGSYLKNKSGGVVRKNVSKFATEVNAQTDGTFKTTPSTGGIVNSLNLLRMHGYDGNGLYTADNENCSYGLSSFEDGDCMNWGNPQSEIYMEAIRYFAGQDVTADFKVTGTDVLTGLTAQPWTDPLNAKNYCAPLNVINFNGSVASYDRDQLTSASDLPGISSVAGLRSKTDDIGADENINGGEWFVGGNGSENNRLCTAKGVGVLSDIMGLCPEGPGLAGGYDSVGLANYAYTTDLRPTLENDQTVGTFSVALAPAVPRIDIARPGQSATAVTILPACTNRDTNNSCAIVDFKVVRQNEKDGTGLFLVNWEDSLQGGDYDQDMYGTIEYAITDSELTVTTRLAGESTSHPMAFGYVLSGTTQNGFHAHSGIYKFSYDDPTGVLGCDNCELGDAATSVTYTLSDGGTGSGLLENPMFYAAKYSGFDKEGDFPDDPASWDADDNGLPDNYYFAIDPSKLADDLESVFADILRQASSAASVAANSSSLTTETSVYQASFNSQNWSGDLRSFTINDDGTLAGTYNWSAAAKLDNLANIDNRNILTTDPLASDGAVAGEVLANAGKSFAWDNLSAAQKTLMRANTDGSSVSVAIGKERLSYLRGERSMERSLVNTDGIFRERESRLGDIVNSNPQFAYQQNFGYARLDNTTAFSGILQEYADFRASDVYQDRPPVVLVGANDGMLHGFNADSADADAGKELFAYVPADVIKNLHALTEFDYQHRYYVDGPPRVADAWLGASEGWKTLAVGSTGGGGKSIFALNITDPENVGDDDFLWEFSHPDMGNTVQQPSVVPLPNGKFGVIVSSGYDGDPNNGGKVWVLDAATGRPIHTFDLPDSGDLGGPLAVDLDADRIVDRVYVGDSKGQLWRLDLDGTQENQWGTPDSLAGEPLFTAPTGHPITAPLSSAFNERGEHMVFFGTGSFFQVGDNAADPNPPVEAFYGIIDEGNTIDKTDLLEQKILAETYKNGKRLRAVSDNQITNQKGWYIDLEWKTSLGGPGPQGERVVSKARIRGDRVIFPTLIPSADVCSAGGQSFLMEVSTSTGGRLDYSVFDVNEDDLFDTGDRITITIGGEDVKVPASGLDPEIGIVNTPTILSDIGSGDDESKVISGSSGQVITVPEAGSRSRGRQNWRQLR